MTQWIDASDKFEQKGQTHEYESKQAQHDGDKKKGKRCKRLGARRGKYFCDKAKHPVGQKLHDDMSDVDHCLENTLPKYLQSLRGSGVNFGKGVAKKNTEKN